MFLHYLIKHMVANKIATLFAILGCFCVGIKGAFYFVSMAFLGTFIWMIFGYDSGEILRKLTKIKAARKYKIAL